MKGGFEDNKKSKPVLNQEPLSNAEVEIEPSEDAPEPPKVDEVEEEEDLPVLPPGVGTSKPLKKKTSTAKRDPGSCLFSYFVPLQLVAHTEEGKSCGKPVVVYDNEQCNSYRSGKFLNCE